MAMANQPGDGAGGGGTCRDFRGVGFKRILEEKKVDINMETSISELFATAAAEEEASDADGVRYTVTAPTAYLDVSEQIVRLTGDGVDVEGRGSTVREAIFDALDKVGAEDASEEESDSE